MMNLRQQLQKAFDESGENLVVGSEQLLNQIRRELLNMVPFNPRRQNNSQTVVSVNRWHYMAKSLSSF